MKKRIFTICALIMCFGLMVAANGMKTYLDFECEMIKTKKFLEKFPKAPVRCPSAYISGHTLYISGCDGCVVQLLCGDDIIYSAVVESGVVVLPEELSGVFRLQMLKGIYCFWAEIEL